MKALAAMVGASLGAWTIVALLVDGPTRLAVLLGLLGPLAMVGVSWLVIERTYRSRPEGMTSVMIGSFGLKLVFVGAYVSVMLGLLAVRRLPFVISFTSYFIVLYVVEALLMRRLFAGGMRAPGSSREM